MKINSLKSATKIINAVVVVVAVIIIIIIIIIISMYFYKCVEFSISY